MAAPTLVGQGGITAVTSGALAPAIPTHQADDILVVTTIVWVPNSAANIANAVTPSGWTLQHFTEQYNSFNLRGYANLYTRRAAGAGETISIARPAEWDTGTDGVWAGRAYVIRNVSTDAVFYDNLNFSTSGLANQEFPAVTVSGSERTVIQFWIAPDNTSISGGVSGWTSGTQLTSATGTDSGFGTFRKENVSASTSADTTSNAAIGSPSGTVSVYVGISFKPIAPAVIIEGSWNMIQAF